MQPIEPLMTAHPLTGALRPITVDLLRETYLIPVQTPGDISQILSDGQGPWSASYDTAPGPTLHAVSTALRTLMMATRRLDPSEVDPSRLAPGSRVRLHAEGLLDLWMMLGDGLPEDLQIIKGVLGASSKDALEPLPILDTGPARFASLLDQSLRQTLIDHHGNASLQHQSLWETRQQKLFVKAASGTALAAVQNRLDRKSDDRVELDESLSFWVVRDLSDEAALTASICQTRIDSGYRAQDLAVLVPSREDYLSHLKLAFDLRGVPLSGLPDTVASRDLAGDTLRNLLLSMRPPAPAMARASLFISPLMPWSAEVGATLARQVMDGRRNAKLPSQYPENSPQRRVIDSIRDYWSAPPSKIAAALRGVAQHLTNDEDHQEDVKRFRGLVPVLLDWLGKMGTEVAWDSLFSAIPEPAPLPTTPQRFVEGVSVFFEDTLPWRSTKHLVILGTSSDHYPSPAPLSSLFVESELQQLWYQAGAQISGRSDHVAQSVEIFRRTLCATSETATFVHPVRSLAGDRTAPAAILNMVARLLCDPESQRPISDIAEVLRDPLTVPQDHRPCTVSTLGPLKSEDMPTAPSTGRIEFGLDLLTLRKGEDGTPKPQSPSRLENLLVSPLAWLLSELDANDRLWMPEGLDALLAGTLAHKVFEDLFEPGSPLPSTDDIDSKVPELLQNAITQNAPFLRNSVWKAETETLLRDILRAAHKWSETLSVIGASVLQNEADIRGTSEGIALRGQFDCLLRLPDGGLLIVDHKKSGSKKRRERLDAGWDLQLTLYRDMLSNPNAQEEGLKSTLMAAPSISVAYHLLNDGVVLGNGIIPTAERIETLHHDISAEALNRLRAQIAQVKGGTIVLNKADDEAFFGKTAKMTPYALTASPLVAAFRSPAEEG